MTSASNHDGRAARASRSGRRSELRLLRYLKPHWRMGLSTLATIGLVAVVEIARPWPLKIVVDNVLGEKPLPGYLEGPLGPLPGSLDPNGLLVWAAVATIIIFLASTFASIANSVIATKLGQRMTFDLAGDVFTHLRRLSLIFHSRRPVGDTISRVTVDSYCVSTLVTGAIVPVLQALVTLVAMFAVMWALEPRLTLLALAVVPLQVAAIRIFGGPMKVRTRERRDLEGEMTSLVHQTLTAMPAVQAFTREQHEGVRYRDYADRTVTAYVRATLAGSWFKLFAGLATALGTAAILYLGARLAMEGAVSVGTVLVFLSYLASLYAPLNSITYTAQTWQTAAAEADRIVEILDLVPDVRERSNARNVRIRDGRVRFENVSFGYEPGNTVLDGVSMEAAPNETVAIVGPTGAGKTTLVSMLVRFFDPWSGRVTVDGVDLRDMRLRSLREQVAIVLQEPFILPMSVAENIAYGRPEATMEEIAAAASAASADDFIRCLPDGYDTEIGERGATLSGGEKQRLAIARAFLKDAPLLVLDEPTSALDARTETGLLETLDRLTVGRTTFVIAHRLSTIRNADRIVVMDRGKIVEVGAHAELLERDGLYATLYLHQMDAAHHDLDVAARLPS
jgi:ATP-binding cassette subfamily B protein/subfamily B ATP-binding cassette protein MsbA